MQTSIPKTKLLITLRTITTSATVSCNERAASECGFLNLLQSCNTFSSLLQIQTQILKVGFQSNPFILSKFVSKASDVNSIEYAHCFLFSPHSNTHFYDAFLFNTIIKAYAQTVNLKPKALWVFNFMLECRVLPNDFTYPVILKACAGIGDLNLGMFVHGSLLKFGLHGKDAVLNTLVHMYCSCRGGIVFGRKVFDEMTKNGPVPWSTMIGGYVRLGRPNDAIDLFRKMQIQGVCPNEITMVAVLCACTDLGIESLIEREKVHKSLELNNALIDMFAKCCILPEIEHYGCMVDMLCRAGLVREAVVYVQKMPLEPNSIIWRTLINACRTHGELKLGETLARQLIRNERMLDANYVLPSTSEVMLRRGKHDSRPELIYLTQDLTLDLTIIVQT